MHNQCVAGGKELTQEDITPNAPSLVVYSRKGYIKRMSADAFTVQGKGGRGACPCLLPRVSHALQHPCGSSLWRHFPCPSSWQHGHTVLIAGNCGSCFMGRVKQRIELALSCTS